MSRSYLLGVVGESHYQSAIAKCEEGETVLLVPEPDNAFDDRAIKVVSVEGKQIGYVPRGSWVADVILDERKSLSATIFSIEGKRPKRGVVIEIARERGELAHNEHDRSTSTMEKDARPSSGLGGCGWSGIAVLATLIIIWWLR